MFCEKCGTPIQKGDQFCMSCGTKVESQNINTVICQNCNTPFDYTYGVCPNCGTVPTSSDEASLEQKDSYIADDVLRCPDCGLEIQENEKYCIRCGTPITKSISTSEVLNTEDNKLSQLQAELSNLFQSNKLFAFLAKYAIAFAMYFPIYLIMDKISALDAVTDIMHHIYALGFYGYYIAMIALFSEKKYMPILIAVTMRLINSIVYMFQGYTVVSSLCSITIYVALLIVFYRLFSKTSQFDKIKKNLNIETKTCPGCGSSVKQNDAFCPKCGNRM